MSEQTVLFGTRNGEEAHHEVNTGLSEDGSSFFLTLSNENKLVTLYLPVIDAAALGIDIIKHAGKGVQQQMERAQHQ